MNMNQSVVMLGGGGVGKSSLTLRLITNNFTDDYDATIEDSYRKVLEVDGKVANLEILDTAGQEEFWSLVDSWVRTAEGVILVYDVSSRQTFEDMCRLYERVVMCKDTKQVPMVVVANKCDLPLGRRQISAVEGWETAREWGCPFVEASARERINDVECFREIVRQMRKHNPDKPVKKQDWCVIL